MDIHKIKVSKIETPITKQEVIIKAGEMLVESGFVTPDYIDLMLEREKIVTTYIGNHLSIPHGTSESQSMIKESGISILQVPEGVSFGDETAYLVVGIAGKDGTHMDILSRIAISCSDPNVVIQASQLEDRHAIIDLLLGDPDE
jgi:mannitol/fructose-specific phosphotransferase system IIA component